MEQNLLVLVLSLVKIRWSIGSTDGVPLGISLVGGVGGSGRVWFPGSLYSASGVVGR